MPLSIVGATQAIHSGSIITLPVPSVQDGDLLLVGVHQDSGSEAALTPPAGWTKRNFWSLTGGHGLHIYYRIANSEPASYDWTDSALAVAFCLAVRGQDATTPFDNTDVAPTQGSGTTVTTNSFAVQTAGALLVAIGVVSIGSPASFTPPSGFVEQADESIGWAAITCATNSAATTGSYGPYTFTSSLSGATAGWLTAIRPASSGTTYTQSFTASLTLSSGTGKQGRITKSVALGLVTATAKSTAKRLSVALTLASAITRRTTRGIAVALSLGTATARTTAKGLSASVGLATATAKAAARGLNSALTLGVTLARQTSRILSASLALGTGFSALRTYLRQFSASLTLSSALSRLGSRTFSTSLTLGSSILKSTSRLLSAPLTLATSFSALRSYLKQFSASLTLSSSLARGASKVFAVPLAVASAIRKTPSRLLSAALTLATNIRRGVSRVLSSSLSLSSGFSRVGNFLRQFSAALGLNTLINLLKGGSSSGPTATDLKPYIDTSPIIPASSKLANRAFEFCYAYGPKKVADAGTGSYVELYSVPYAYYLDRDTNTGKLLKWDGSNWVDVPSTLYPQPPVPVNNIRHVWACFDQSARLAIAYEYNQNVYVYQFDPVSSAYVVRGPFPGVDPRIFWDYPLDVTIFPASFQPNGNSDIVLFHLSVDRLSAGYRLQRDLYNIFYPVVTFAQPQHLDQVFPTLTRECAVAFSDSSNTPKYAVSDPYPLIYADPVRLDATPTEIGRYAVTYQASANDAVRMAAQPISVGRYNSIYQYTATDSVRFAAQPTGATRTLTIYQVSTNDSVRFTAQPMGATRTIIIAVQSSLTDSVRMTAQPTQITRKAKV